MNFQAIERAVTKLVGVNISVPNRQKKIKSLSPKKFSLERTTVWSFKSRGSWATHNGNYRGNWSPYIPRNIINRFSKEGETVLDCFCGSGATAVEAKLLNRNFIGVDVNPNAIELAKENTSFSNPLSLSDDLKPETELKVGDARDLAFLQDNSIDLICTHPPYSDIIQYTDNQKQDLSFLEMDDFLEQMQKVAQENHRVLKDNGYCAILIGDMRKNKHVVPLGFRLIDVYLQNGFVLKELIIKRQHNCRTTGFWYKNSIKYNFLLLAHEYLAVFKKAPTLSKNALPIRETQNDSTINPTSIPKMETTTVWVFHPSNWCENAIRNIVERYDGKDHVVVHGKQPIEGSHTVVILDLESGMSSGTRAQHVENAAVHINDGGYLALICSDVRLGNGTTCPTALQIMKETESIRSLMIREIVVVSPEDSAIPDAGDNLSITHKYILIFQKKPS